MLSLPLTLPAGALLDHWQVSLDEMLGDLGGVWFSFDSALAEIEDGAIATLRARVGTMRARRTEANTGNGRLGRFNGADVLETRPRENCGFVLTERIDCALIGLICVFASPTGAAETIACVDSRNGDSALVLVERGGTITLTDRNASAVASVAAGPGMQAVFATIAPDQIALIGPEASAVTANLPGSFQPGPCDVFMACRRGRAGLHNTLGDLRLAEVICLPNMDICQPDAAQLRDTVRAYVEKVFGHGV